jgi:opacity protein-like surface antigen
MRLRRALLVTTAVSTVLLGGAGMAYAQAFDWSGFYVGVGVAGGTSLTDGELSWFDPENEIWSTAVLGSSTTTDDEPFVGLDDVSMDFPGAGGFGLGVFGTVGFNTQMDNFLFGIEASITSGPFAIEDKFVEQGSVSYTTTTLSGSTTTFTTTDTFATSTLEFTSSLLTYITTVTHSPTTLTFTTTASTTIFQTTTIANGTTYAFPTTSTVETTTNTVSFNTSTTGYSESATTFTNTFATTGTWTETITGRAQIDWLATIKGRIGVTADRTLFFATGGLAIAGVSQETTAILHVDGESGGTTTTWSGSNDDTRFGFVVGGGIEQALDDHWIVSGEFEYFNLGTAEYDVLPENNVVQNHGHQTQVLDGGSVKFGVKYKF